MSIPFKNAPQLRKVGNEFERHFHVKFKDYYDHKLSIMTKSIKFDIEKFENYLDNKYKINDNKISMADCVGEHYGVDALEFLKQLL